MQQCECFEQLSMIPMTDHGCRKRIWM